MGVLAGQMRLFNISIHQSLLTFQNSYLSLMTQLFGSELGHGRLFLRATERPSLDLDMNRWIETFTNLTSFMTLGQILGTIQ